jgi:hypothetical protein
MTIRPTTIWEAARNRFADWASMVRCKEGLRSLPGSHRFTDKDIWSAPNRFGEADKSQCGSANRDSTHKPGRRFQIPSLSGISPTPDGSQEPTPHLLGLRFFAWFPKAKVTDKGPHTEHDQRMAALSRRTERIKPLSA